MRLELGTSLARAAGSLSRLAGRGGGTTLPGKLLTTVDPGAIARLARKLPSGSVLVSATNGKTTTAAMAATILSPRFRLAHNAAGANLASGVATALVAARDAELGLFEVDEAALPQLAAAVQPRAICLSNLFRDQLDRYGELELVAERWRQMAETLPAETLLLLNADDPLVADLARSRSRTTTFGLDDPAQRGPSLQHAADSKYCVRCGTPYAYDAAYVGHLGDYRCPACGHSRPALDLAARAVEPHGMDGISFDLSSHDGTARIRLRLPGVHNVYNALAAASLARALDVPLEDIATGLERASAAFGRFERVPVDDKTLVVLLIKNPAGANESVRTLLQSGGPGVAVVALNDGIADGRDVSWIWDVDFEPLAQGLERLVASGERAAELALRFSYGGLDEGRIEVIPDLAAALDRGLELTEAGGELVFLPTYTAMLGLQRVIAERGYARPYWERVA
ncbi:MAG TPA: MurT ligase domain-containing protein [Gaiellaceae bacterium]|nr:MurT ligase domain-containing protein [Gaiellaceae bacterium]